MGKIEHSRGEVTSISWLDWTGKLLRGSILAGVLVLLGLLIGAFCISKGIIGQEKMEGIVLASCTISAFIGGIFANGRYGLRAIPVGLSVGMLLFLLCAMAGIVIYGNGGLGSNSVGVLCACLCGGTMSGVLCRKGKKKAKR